MTLKLNTVAFAVLAAFAAASHAEGIDLKFSGFGTLAAVHSSERGADYVATRFQPNGAGHTRSTDFGTETKLGGQVAAKFGDKVSGVVQVISQHQADNTYKPMLEWANVKVQFNDALSFRAGRIALPSYLLSESRFVGYASPWAHAPSEVYSVLAVTSNDGVDMTWRSGFGDANNTLQVFYGQGSSKLPSGKAKSKPTWGFNDSVEIGSLLVRGGYTNVSLDLQVGSLDPLFAGIKQFAAGAAAVPVPAFQTSAAQATDLLEKYRLDSMKLSAIVLGMNYDPGAWFVMSELVAFKGDGFLTNSTSWYVTGGYRIGSWTPYATYSSTKAHIDAEAGITAAGGTPLATGAAGINAGINATLTQFNGSQDSLSAGVRWDAVRNVALKLQVERVSVKNGSNGRFANVQPTFPMNAKVNLVTMAADFVF
ncbi:MAG: hypothetical protein EOP35_11800 [Rubrivivax sp.]|nr:MAG: hypothetical protein EOP35_11800 [Rubrivivax sp.]